MSNLKVLTSTSEESWKECKDVIEAVHEAVQKTNTSAIVVVSYSKDGEINLSYYGKPLLLQGLLSRAEFAINQGEFE